MTRIIDLKFIALIISGMKHVIYGDYWGDSEKAVSAHYALLLLVVSIVIELIHVLNDKRAHKHFNVCYSRESHEKNKCNSATYKNCISVRSRIQRISYAWSTRYAPDITKLIAMACLAVILTLGLDDKHANPTEIITSILMLVIFLFVSIFSSQYCKSFKSKLALNNALGRISFTKYKALSWTSMTVLHLNGLCLILFFYIILNMSRGVN
jgi:hypothetical protein